MASSDITSKPELITAGKAAGLKTVLGLVAVVAMVVVLAELGIRFLASTQRVSAKPADIQTPETLCHKIATLRQFNGRRILVMGDSLALGEAMKAKGNLNWREQEIGSALGDALPSDTRPTLIMNLGMNGGLPADQARILEMLKGEKLDAVVSFISIRSFSGDFSKPDDAYSRKWFSQLQAHPTLGCITRSDTESSGLHLKQFFRENLSLLRNSDLLQRVFFDTSLRNWLEAGLKAQGSKTPQTAANAETSPEVLLLARRRFLNISFQAPHLQVAAIKEIREAVPMQTARTVFVYGQESSRNLPSLLNRQLYNQHRLSLATLLSPGCSVSYIDRLLMPPERYIDYVHVDSEGYKLMARAIGDSLAQPLPQCS
jgi:lysophospholipase L1-like esterase